MSKRKSDSATDIVAKKVKVADETEEASASTSSDLIKSASSQENSSSSAHKYNFIIASWNINGLRALTKSKGTDYLKKSDCPDIVAFQETKCSKDDIPNEIEKLGSCLFKSVEWSSAEKAGYAGTAIFSKLKPLSVKHGINKSEHDSEGRVITEEFEKFFFVTAYVPNSGRGLTRLDYREKQWDPDFRAYIKKLDSKKPVIVCGDLNVAHKEIDLKNPKTNKRTAGFTIEERESFDKLLEEVDLVDTFRHFYPKKTDAYTFWSYMRNSRAKNVGWRLDYFLVSRRFMKHITDSKMQPDVMGSDHCPIKLFLKL